MKKSTKAIRWFIFTVISAIVMMTATVFSASADGVITEKAAKQSGQQTVMEQADTGGLVQWIEGLSGTVKTIGMAIGGVAVLVLGIMLIGGGNGAISKSKGVAIGICAGIAVIGFGPAIISELASATGANAALYF
ncbi:MAG: hypothetical protein IJ571_00585 [Ruminococcus sp.]|nr:hypothetical protein [Ruminococcus sp.]